MWRRCADRPCPSLPLNPARPIGAPMTSVRPWRDIVRRESRQIMVGNVPVGGDAPITVQTMTNTLTSDAKATIDQIRRC
ncbi:MAG: flavodoxin-dependent (E)-4-hydroxy-3-methylbut-2-enyl-diphosphate synthase, partial [Croceibacterium sp.]